MIKFNEISVVIQGAIDNDWTQRSILSVIQYLPGATIVLSTWSGADVSNLEFYDVLVESNDPGYNLCSYEGTKNNLARQIVSTKNGLKQVKTKFAMKIRSDMTINGIEYINAFQLYSDCRSEEFKILKNRIIVSNFYCRNPKRIDLPFHVSDWFQFGLTEDLLNLWDIEPNEPENSHYFLSREKPQNVKELSTELYGTLFFRYFPEQFIWINFLKKNLINVDVKHYLDNTEENIFITEKSFANNLVILDYAQSGINFNKFDPYLYARGEFTEPYTHKEWQRLYKQYCNPSFKVEDEQPQDLPYDFKREARKYVKMFTIPFRVVIRWVISPLKVFN